MGDIVRCRTSRVLLRVTEVDGEDIYCRYLQSSLPFMDPLSADSLEFVV